MGKRCKNCGACQECGAPASPQPVRPWPVSPWYPGTYPYFPYWSVSPPYGTPTSAPRITYGGTYGNSATGASPSPATSFNYSAIGGATNVAATVPLH